MLCSLERQVALSWMPPSIQFSVDQLLLEVQRLGLGQGMRQHLMMGHPLARSLIVLGIPPLPFSFWQRWTDSAFALSSASPVASSFHRRPPRNPPHPVPELWQHPSMWEGTCKLFSSSGRRCSCLPKTGACRTCTPKPSWSQSGTQRGNLQDRGRGWSTPAWSEDDHVRHWQRRQLITVPWCEEGPAGLRRQAYRQGYSPWLSCPPGAPCHRMWHRIRTGPRRSSSPTV